MMLLKRLQNTLNYPRRSDAIIGLILFDGYLIIKPPAHNSLLKISDLLFDGYLIVTLKKHLFKCPPTCKWHVVAEESIELKEVLAT